MYLLKMRTGYANWVAVIKTCALFGVHGLVRPKSA
jgi:hypothetical protein